MRVPTNRLQPLDHWTSFLPTSQIVPHFGTPLHTQERAPTRLLHHLHLPLHLHLSQHLRPLRYLHLLRCLHRTHCKTCQTLHPCHRNALGIVDHQPLPHRMPVMHPTDHSTPSVGPPQAAGQMTPVPLHSNHTTFVVPCMPHLDKERQPTTPPRPHPCSTTMITPTTSGPLVPLTIP